MLGSRRKGQNSLGSSSKPLSYGEGSPTKASKWIKADSSEYINNLVAKQQNISTSLDLYKTCYENQLPQKCLKHLNFITLYCADERKLLCVNCLYGSTLHKNHTVTPSNQMQQQIKRDNEENMEILDEEIMALSEAEKQLKENKRQLDASHAFIMKEIDREFNEMQMILKRKHDEVKARAQEEFMKTFKDNEVTSKQVSHWRSRVHDMRGRLPRDNKNEEGEIYKHLVLDTVLNEQMETQKLTYMASKQDIEDDLLHSTRELHKVIEYHTQQGTHRAENRSKERKMF